MTVTRPSWARAISVLVPMSIAMDGRFLPARCVAAITASASEPTNPAMGGGKCTPPLRVHVDAELTRAQRERLGRRRGERRLAEADGREAESEVVHRRVADDGHVADVVGVDLLALVEHGQVRVDAAADGRREGGRLAVLRRVGDAADDSPRRSASAGSRRASWSMSVPRAQVEEVGDDLGGADVDGDAVELAVALAGVHVDNALAVDRRRGPPLALAQFGAADTRARAAAPRRRRGPRRSAPDRSACRPASAAPAARRRYAPPDARRRASAWTW